MFESRIINHLIQQRKNNSQTRIFSHFYFAFFAFVSSFRLFILNQLLLFSFSIRIFRCFFFFSWSDRSINRSFIYSFIFVYCLWIDLNHQFFFSLRLNNCIKWMKKRFQFCSDLIESLTSSYKDCVNGKKCIHFWIISIVYWNEEMRKL